MKLKTNVKKKVQKMNKHTKNLQDYDYIFFTGLFLLIVVDSITTYVAIQYLGLSEGNPLGKFLFHKLSLPVAITITKTLALLLQLYIFYPFISKYKYNTLTVRQTRLVISGLLLIVGSFVASWNSAQIIKVLI